MGFNYIEEANVTMSDEFHEGVPSMLVVSGLMAISEDIEKLDRVKKFMFYGRENEGLNRITEVARVLHPDSCHDIDFASLLPNKSKEDAVRIFHGIIGIITEAGELAEALAQAIVTGEQLDLTNVAEEVGDNQWYAAAILRVLGTTFDDVQRTNIAKLRARFPNKFDAHDANNRNLERERKILERKDLNQIFNEHEAELQKANTKPIVQIKNWSIVGNRLFGIALNHPRAPNGGESDVSTTRILSQEGNRVETVNTIYELIGDTVTEQT